MIGPTNKTGPPKKVNLFLSVDNNKAGHKSTDASCLEVLLPRWRGKYQQQKIAITKKTIGYYTQKCGYDIVWYIHPVRLVSRRTKRAGHKAHGNILFCVLLEKADKHNETGKTKQTIQLYDSMIV